MSENPPQYKEQPEVLKDLQDYPETPHLKILKRQIEEGRILTDAEGGGKESVETIVECNGKEHTEIREKITYNSQGGMKNVEELEKTVLGACDCADRADEAQIVAEAA